MQKDDKSGMGYMENRKERLIQEDSERNQTQEDHKTGKRNRLIKSWKDTEKMEVLTIG